MASRACGHASRRSTRRGSRQLDDRTIRSDAQLIEHGGARRLLAIVPTVAASAAEREQLWLPRSVLANSRLSRAEPTRLILCVEAEQLPLSTVALQLVQRRRDSVEFAKRVHSRSDVAWTPLVSCPDERSDKASQYDPARLRDRRLPLRTNRSWCRCMQSDQHMTTTVIPIERVTWLLTGQFAEDEPVRHIRVDESPFVVGRQQDASLSIPSPTVSRRHAELHFAGDKLYLVDLGSTNGTFVNGIRIQGECDVNHGDLLQFGQVVSPRH